MCQLSWHGWVDSCEGIRLQALTIAALAPIAALRGYRDPADL